MTAATGNKSLSKVEAIKVQSDFLREPLATELTKDTHHFSEPAVQILKFHGSYQQDNRDSRQERRQSGLDRDYTMMLRTRNPGGYLPAPLYLTLDRLADQYGSGTLRITTRQTVQLHGVLKQDLKTVIQHITADMGSTLATCGDINRNVMAPPAPFKHEAAYVHAHTYARKLSDLLAPHSGAYYDLWLDETQIPVFTPDLDVETARHALVEPVKVEGSPEPLYGQTYLPRKFKCALAIPEDNSVDVYSQDIGLIVLTSSTGVLLGFNIVVGGGMGRTHGKEETVPLLAQPLGFVTPDDVYGVVQAIVAVQRDNGNRHDRRLARMKYLIQDWGIPKFRRAVEAYCGQKLKRFRKIPAIIPRADLGYLGWHEQGDGKLFLGLSIANGRVVDTETRQLKSALRLITERFQLPIQLAPSQDLLFTDIDPTLRSQIDTILIDHGVAAADAISGLVKRSMACPALPTCGLAITESERIIPDFLTQLQALLTELHLDQEAFIVRMTGCPNGCARPYLAELGLVGVSPEAYQLWLGGSPRGERLAQVFLEKVAYTDLIPTLKPILTAFHHERYSQENFGDYCHRRGWDYLRGLVLNPLVKS